MSKSTKASLVFDTRLSPSFVINKGLKQGDILSTLFFNIFINDLPDALNIGALH